MGLIQAFFVTVGLMLVVTGGGLMCTICYPFAMYLMKLENSSQHQSGSVGVLGFLCGVLTVISKNYLF
jgi:ABC-type nickel/cobalt efflux system permease component RcnA